MGWQVILFKPFACDLFHYFEFCGILLLLLPGFPVQLVIRNLLLLQVFYILSDCKYGVNIKLQFDTLQREIHSWHCLA